MNPWEMDWKGGEGEAEPPVRAGPNTPPAMAKTLADIEAGKPAPPLNWKGEPIPVGGVPGGVPAKAPWEMKWEEGKASEPPEKEPPGFLDTVKTFDFKEGLLGRAATGLGQWLRDLQTDGKSLEELSASGATFKQKPSPKKAPPVGEAIAQLARHAKENPGATLGEFVKAAGEDFWMFLVPEFGTGAKLGQVLERLASKAGSVAGKVAAGTGRVAGTFVEKGAVGAAAEGAAQTFEPGSYDGNAMATSGVMWGTLGALGPAFGAFWGKARRGIPEADLKAGKASDATVDSILKDWETSTGNKEGITRDDIRQQTDADINATKKAYDFMQRGASRKETLRERKKDPLFGEKLDEFMAKRQEFRSGDLARGVIQGEVLAPEIPGVTGLPPKGPPLLEGPKAPIPAEAVRRIERGAADPKLLAAMGIGGAALLASMYPSGERSDDMPWLAAGAVLTAGAAKGKLPPGLPASALASLMRGERYTTKILDRIPQNRSEYPKTMLEEQLRRPDVVKPEKDMIQGILDETPGDTITARELVEGVKKATGDHELTPVKTQKFADYGLDNLDLDTGELTPDSVRTTLYRSPFETGGQNHFNDPKLFGWTRSFDEGGVKHVVEIQSDLAQHAKGALTGPSLEQARLALIIHKQNVEYLEKKLVTPTSWLPTDSQTFITRELQRERLLLQETELKLNSTGTQSSLGPILKSWPRRLIREELAAAAREGQPTVRFASADTVAKVEGWPEPRANAESRLAKLQEDLQRYDARGGSAENRKWYTDLIEHEQNLLKGLPEQRFTKEHQSIYNRYAGDITKFLKTLGGKEYTDPQGHTWIEVPTQGRGRSEIYGRIDPELLKVLSFAGGGAVLAATVAQEKEIARALMGAAAGAALPWLWRNGFGKAVHDAGGVLSTEMRKESRRLGDYAVDYERRVSIGAHEDLMAVDPFLRRLVKTPADIQPELASAIFSGNRVKTLALLRKIGDPELTQEWVKMRQKLDERGRDLMEHGRLSALRQDYFPRIVTDLEGLLASLGTVKKTALEKALAKAKARAANDGTPFTELEQSRIINQFLQHGPQGQGKPGFTKARVLEEVTPEQLQFYATPMEALHTYMVRSRVDLEKARFFGKTLQTKNGQVQLDESIAGLVGEELNAGRLKPAQVDRVSELLRSRFGQGEVSGSKAVQAVRDVTNIGLLGNFYSALTQLGDIPATVSIHGIKPVLTAVAYQLTGKAPTHAREFGLVDRISEEFVSQAATAKTLNRVFKAVGFTAIDQFGKGTALNASFFKNKALMGTERGRAQFTERWGEFFGEDLAKVMDDFQAGRLTSDVKAVLWQDLSRTQPISRMEMPKFFNDNPNLRALYMLKSFTLKQLDLVRAEGFQKIAKGDVRGGMAFLARYTTIMTLAGMGVQEIKDFLTPGKPFDLTVAATENLLKTFGWSAYALDKMREGKLIEGAGTLIAPPVKMWQEIVKADPQAARYIPGIGKIIYENTDYAKEKRAKWEKVKAGRTSAEARRKDMAVIE